MSWTDYDRSRLRGLVAAGYPRTRIARLLGKTLGQVCGMCHRLKLRLPPELARSRQSEPLAKGWKAAQAMRAQKRLKTTLSDKAAAEMVEQALAAGRITKCPPRYCAPIQGI